MSTSSKLVSFAKLIFKAIPFIVIFGLSIPIIGMAQVELGKYLGLRKLPVPVVGTGSMYPSLFWDKQEGGPEDQNTERIEEYRTTPLLYRNFAGIKIFNQKYFERSLGYGDMVAFSNSKTIEILSQENKDPSNGFIKRIIGVPGDVIELRGGFVYKNQELLEEPYLASPRSTYAGITLAECKAVTVPENSYFVLGDNRKVSSDSRSELGFVYATDIEFVLPYAQQELYHSLWRDTSKDKELLGQPTLNPQEFLQLLNEVRRSKRIPPLTLKSGLTRSSTLRGERLLADENTKFDLRQAVTSAGYSNIILGEFVSYGHYSAKELLDSLLYQPNLAKQILNPDYTELGISDVNREIGGCPSQVIVGHLGGYLPAEYDESTLNSWRSLRDNISSVLPSWEAAVGYNNLDQDKLSQLLNILRRRLNLAQEVVAVMEDSEWINSDLEARIKNDENDAKESERLSKELNQ